MINIPHDVVTAAQAKRKLLASLKKVNASRITLAHDFRWAMTSVNWRYSEYKSWSKFCVNELGLSETTVYQYTRTAGHIERLGYTDKECHEMLLDFSWKHFTRVLPKLKEKLPPTEVVEKFKSLSRTGTHTIKGETVFEKGQVFSFTLQSPLSDKLDERLMPLGMTISAKGHRKGLRNAITQFLQEVL